ncbi:hypothetical protein DPMN_002476 [Dreissena polymorpha]|uniref:Uncharacterized protein n=1 Tax=Dreissena polymorpha TaxID=45954 RepID=A0A9D4RRS8_DREPO|nr:hypothetical protein DPMN_002476 [Dreissena polymorpha]
MRRQVEFRRQATHLSTEASYNSRHVAESIVYLQCTLANEALMCPVPCGDDVVWITQSASHTTYIQDTQHDRTPSSPGKYDQDTHI